MNSQQDECSEETSAAPRASVKEEVLTPLVLEFLKTCLLARLNVAIFGPSQNQNAKLLQALACLLPDEDQTLAILNPEEARLTSKGFTTLRANLCPTEGKSVITRAYLLTLVPKMHPQRLLVDGVQGPEALALLKVLFAMDGVMFSVVAESPSQAFASLEQMALLSDAGVSVRMMRRVLAGSLDLVIQSKTVNGGLTRVVSVSEVSDLEDDVIVLRDIFALRQVCEEGIAPVPVLSPTGTTPYFLDRMRRLGISLPSAMLA